MMKKGSITVYLSLTFAVMLTLILVCIDSARYSCGRAAAAASAEEGMFSLFGEYDRIIYQKYGLLCLDGGYEGKSLKAGALMDEIMEAAEKVMFPGTSLLGLRSENLFRLSVDENAVTGYVLATDDNAAALRKQICSLMELKIGADAVENLASMFAGTGDFVEQSENNSELDMDNIQEKYDQLKESALQNSQNGEETSGDGGIDTSEESSTEKTAAVSVPADFDNPIETVGNMAALGLFSNVIPGDRSVSDICVDLSEFPENRTLQQGFGIMPDYDENAFEHFFLAKYIIDFFPNFVSSENDDSSALKYQAEYAIAGKDSDEKNLEAVLGRLLAVRELMNFIYLNTNPEKKAEAEEIAFTVASVFLIPESSEVITQLMLLCWAYGESMNDLKILLAGGKVPFIKDETSWRSDLIHIGDLALYEEELNSSGLSYSDYLYILLLMNSDDYLSMKTVNLLEYNRRISGNSEDFSIDTCLCSLDIEIGGTIGNHDFVLNRSYGYDMD